MLYERAETWGAVGEGERLGELLSIIARMEEDSRRGAPIDPASLRRAILVLPSSPGARPMLDELALLAARCGDAEASALVAARRAPVTASLPAASPPPVETDLLLTLEGKLLARDVRVLFVVGAHRYQERPVLARVFPRLQRVVLFEPHPGLFQLLERDLAGDPTTTVLPYAVSDRCGRAPFHVTDNDAASSSLLEMRRHRELFPHVREVGTIAVEVRTLDAAVAEHHLPRPDALLLDVQGAEYGILSAASLELLSSVVLVYTEASTEEVYAGARTLADVSALLADRFQLVGFAPLCPEVPTHGNALLVRRGRVQDALVAGSVSGPRP
jgi:FkbM family methyltransferase